MQAKGSRQSHNCGLAVHISSISRHYGAVCAVDNVSLEVQAGEFFSLLGPSGSGKTTLLMMLAGFDEPTSGRLVVGDRDLTRVPANKRNIGMVFQKYALFPHMSVADNIAFPLRMRGLSRAERDERVRRALAMVKLEGYDSRMPGQLSGGQQQRIALARAIVFNPPVILMDEPLGALDKKLRQHLQLEIKQLQERLGATVIYVTHDQEEALTMSDRIAVLNSGKVMQFGQPSALYHKPANAFVADFLGEMNFIPGEVVGSERDECQVRVGAAVVTAQAPDGLKLQTGTKVRIAVRPERMSILAEDAARERTSRLSGHVTQLVFNGASLIVLVELDQGPTVRASVNTQSKLAELQVGEAISVAWSARDAHAYPEPA
ncbi:ABC transporter ATP-binding protein [Mesorhizobium amorphae]|uniref:ABC transporter ATP-binding protein n=1 Tax=Mesorhizobium amorphae TaxID=71433 RepID=UPI0017811D81|nr:ABC transporter ATP-binding protein [Mesorhizobium amorphae]